MQDRPYEGGRSNPGAGKNRNLMLAAEAGTEAEPEAETEAETETEAEAEAGAEAAGTFSRGGSPANE
jgi:hypothetical protein